MLMENFPKPIVVISKSLGFACCRYNGEIIETPFVHKLKGMCSFIRSIRTLKSGVGVPRKPIRIVSVDGDNRLHQSIIEEKKGDRLLFKKQLRNKE
jgi:uncharacterized protein YbbK (DUF523 family)